MIVYYRVQLVCFQIAKIAIISFIALISFIWFIALIWKLKPKVESWEYLVL